MNRINLNFCNGVEERKIKTVVQKRRTLARASITVPTERNNKLEELPIAIKSLANKRTNQVSSNRRSVISQENLLPVSDVSDGNLFGSMRNSLNHDLSLIIGKENFEIEVKPTPRTLRTRI